jgi:alpha-ketoglutarate-dependent taurine dioxygenase
MNNPALNNSIVKRMTPVKRRLVSVSAEELVALKPLNSDSTLPLMITPTFRGIDLAAWIEKNRPLVATHLLKHGAILFRDFEITTVAGFEGLIRTVSSELLEYRERSSPRSQVQGGIYTSTDHPPDQTIFLHNENSYQQVWPRKIFFFCVTAPQQRGETPIADCRNVYKRIDPRTIERFKEKQVMYIRNFGDGFGLSWQTVFQTTDRGVVERQCRNSGIAFEWKEGNRLRTRTVRPALARHPDTGEMIWFNHAVFFHVTTLEPSTRSSLLAEFAEEDLPTNTFYGDGSRIEPCILSEIREAYLREQVVFPWRERDVLMVDNMLVAHGRAPFTGPRKILVGMSEPTSERGN